MGCNQSHINAYSVEDERGGDIEIQQNKKRLIDLRERVYNALKQYNTMPQTDYELQIKIKDLQNILCNILETEAQLFSTVCVSKQVIANQLKYIESVDQDFIKLINQLPNKNEYNIVKGLEIIPDVDTKMRNNVEKLNGPINMGTLNTIANTLFDLCNEDVKKFPQNVVLLATLVQIVAKDENKCDDEKFVSAFKMCELARLSQSPCEIKEDIKNIKRSLVVLTS